MMVSSFSYDAKHLEPIVQFSIVLPLQNDKGPVVCQSFLSLLHHTAACGLLNTSRKVLLHF